MRVSARMIALAAVGMMAASTSAFGFGSHAPEAENINAQFLTTFAPVITPFGTTYGARLTCGVRQSGCIISATVDMSLTDGDGVVLHSYQGEYAPEEASSTWRIVAHADGINADVLCSTAEMTYVMADGTTNTIATGTPLCVDNTGE